MWIFLSQGCDNINQTRKRLVYVLCFTEPITSYFWLIHPFAASQIYQMEAAPKHASRSIGTRDMNGQYTTETKLVCAMMKMMNCHRKWTPDLCERLLLLLIAVEPIDRLISPSFIKFMTSIVDFTGRNVASGRAKPFSLIQLRISNVLIVKKPMCKRIMHT